MDYLNFIGKCISRQRVKKGFYLYLQADDSTKSIPNYFISALHPLLITLALIGKSCITGAFGTLYVWSAELYPTVVRNSGMGSSSAIARVGSMLAPYIAKLVSRH